MPQWTRYGTIPGAAYLAAGRIAEAAAEVDKGWLRLSSDRRGYRGPLLRLWAEVLMQQEPLNAVAAGERCGRRWRSPRSSWRSRGAG
jgi:hypothetical protein